MSASLPVPSLDSLSDLTTDLLPSLLLFLVRPQGQLVPLVFPHDIACRLFFLETSTPLFSKGGPLFASPANVRHLNPFSQLPYLPAHGLIFSLKLLKHQDWSSATPFHPPLSPWISLYRLVGNFLFWYFLSRFQGQEDPTFPFSTLTSPEDSRQLRAPFFTSPGLSLFLSFLFLE